MQSPPQEWASRFAAPLLEWYGQDARVLPWRSEPTPYRVWVSEIMLQQTRVEPAIPYFERFMRELPDIPALAAAPTDRLYKLWEGLGYYSRAKNMQKAARMLLEEYGGRFPLTVREMTRLPGIGDYTAGAILSIAFGMPVPAVDGNVLRVFSRAALYEGDVTLPAAKRDFSAFIQRILPPGRPGDFNQALMDLGAVICRPHGEPLCAACPVRGCCGALREGRQQELPKKPPKKARRTEARTVLLFVSPRGVLLRRRPAEGLLGGMWEYPCLDGTRTKAEVSALCAAHGLEAGVTKLAPARHIFTHLEWHMAGYLVRTRPFEAADGFVWAGREALLSAYAVPSAYKTYTALLLRMDGA